MVVFSHLALYVAWDSFFIKIGAPLLQRQKITNLVKTKPGISALGYTNLISMLPLHLGWAVRRATNFYIPPVSNSKDEISYIPPFSNSKLESSNEL